MARNLRSEIIGFLVYLAGHSPRRVRWDPDGSRGDGTPATVLEFEGSIPRPPFRRIGATRISVTSKHERLRASRFGAAAGAINKTGAQGHGRTLTCLLAGEPVAALSYHLEDGAILLVTAIAVLEDDARSEEAELSRVLAGVLLAASPSPPKSEVCRHGSDSLLPRRRQRLHGVSGSVQRPRRAPIGLPAVATCNGPHRACRCVSPLPGSTRRRRAPPRRRASAPPRPVRPGLPATVCVPR